MFQPTNGRISGWVFVFPSHCVFFICSEQWGSRRRETFWCRLVGFSRGVAGRRSAPGDGQTLFLFSFWRLSGAPARWIAQNVTLATVCRLQSHAGTQQGISRLTKFFIFSFKFPFCGINKRLLLLLLFSMLGSQLRRGKESDMQAIRLRTQTLILSMRKGVARQKK